MNQFTKNELETLAMCVSTYAKDEPNDYMPLFDKICAMVNNYCEHNPCQHKEIVTEAYPRSGPPKKREVCGEFYK